MTCCCRVTNFTAVENAALQDTDAVAYLLPAGANKLLADNSTDANQCAFSAEADRAAMRGGPWVAITADIPQASIYVRTALLSVFAALNEHLREACQGCTARSRMQLHFSAGYIQLLFLMVCCEVCLPCRLSMMK